MSINNDPDPLDNDLFEEVKRRLPDWKEITDNLAQANGALRKAWIVANYPKEHRPSVRVAVKFLLRRRAAELEGRISSEENAK